MLSSTSNSNARIPSIPYGKLWVGTLLLVVLLLSAWELFWRVQGFRPSVNDSAELWASARSSVARNRADSLVLVGSSRMQLGINLTVFEQLTGVRPIQLAIAGDTGLDVLRDLSADTSFRGTVICELKEYYLESLTSEAEENTISSAYLTEFRKGTLSSRFEGSLRRQIEKVLVLKLPILSPNSLFTSLHTHTLPKPAHWIVQPDRSVLADFSNVADLPIVRTKALAELRGMYNRSPPLTIQEFESRIEILSVIIRALNSHGANVIFVRLPISESRFAIDEQRYPKEVYWDLLARNLPATVIHYKDYSELSRFDCPDTSHLDYRDTGPFTQALIGIIKSDLRLKPEGLGS